MAVMTLEAFPQDLFDDKSASEMGQAAREEVLRVQELDSTDLYQLAAGLPYTDESQVSAVEHFKQETISRLQEHRINISLAQAALKLEPKDPAWVLVHYQTASLGRMTDAIHSIGGRTVAAIRGKTEDLIPREVADYLTTAFEAIGHDSQALTQDGQIMPVQAYKGGLLQAAYWELKAVARTSKNEAEKEKAALRAVALEQLADSLGMKLTETPDNSSLSGFAQRVVMRLKSNTEGHTSFDSFMSDASVSKLTRSLGMVVTSTLAVSGPIAVHMEGGSSEVEPLPESVVVSQAPVAEPGGETEGKVGKVSAARLTAIKELAKDPGAISGRQAGAMLKLIHQGKTYDEALVWMSKAWEKPKVSKRPDTDKLLDLIAGVESEGNYNAYFNNSDNDTIIFTSMTVGEVLTWQRQFVANGSRSSAVGRYQFLSGTLEGLAKQMDVSMSATFDEALQERFAVALLERRGLKSFMAGRLSSKRFAHKLSQEWASLPKATGRNPEAGYYDGDGLNQSLVGTDEVFAALDAAKGSVDGGPRAKTIAKKFDKKVDVLINKALVRARSAPGGPAELGPIVGKNRWGEDVPRTIGGYKYFAQVDKRWHKIEYNYPGGTGKDIGDSACGSFTATTIINIFNDDPGIGAVGMTDYFQRKGYRYNGGSSRKGIQEAIERFGRVETQRHRIGGLTRQEAKNLIREALKRGSKFGINGKDSIASTPATTASHFYVIRDLDPEDNDRVYVLDPNSTSKSLVPHSLDTILEAYNGWLLEVKPN